MSTPAERHRICALSDLPDPGTLEFSVGKGEWPVKGFLVHFQGHIHAFRNRCPHAGDLLNWGGQSFFAPDRPLLLCTSHGALFKPDDGTCVMGPCVGQRLRKLEIEIADGSVWFLGGAPDVFEAYWRT